LISTRNCFVSGVAPHGLDADHPGFQLVLTRNMAFEPDHVSDANFRYHVTFSPDDEAIASIVLSAGSSESSS
jgi:hypothetical protein